MLKHKNKSVVHSLFYRWGTLVYRFRWLTLALTGIMLALSVVILPHLLDSFQSTGFIDESAPSARALQEIDKKLGYEHTNQFILLYQSDRLKADSPLFLSRIQASLAGLKDFPVKHEFLLPDNNPQQRSKDNHSATVVVTIFDEKPLSQQLLANFETAIKTPAEMTLHLGGEAIFSEWITKQTQKDLYKADKIALPISIVVLLLVFGSGVAAVVPVFLGGGCALAILMVLYHLSHQLSLSVFTLNIAILLGLCLCLDYSLFIVSRFRKELQKPTSNGCKALSMTLATSGRAVFFSGLAVFVSLSALLIFPINILFSIGIGGLVAAAMAMVFALLVLPAMLAILHKRINWLSLPGFHLTHRREGIWRRIATFVVRHSILFFCTSLCIVMFFVYPVINVKFGFADYHILPKDSERRQFFDNYAQKFDEQELSPIVLLVSSHEPILAPSVVGKLVDFTHQIQRNPLVSSVSSIVTINPHFTKAMYQEMYQTPNHLDGELQKVLHATTRSHMTVMRIISRYPTGSNETNQLMHQLREMASPADMTLQWTGEPVINQDMQDSITRLFPYALILVMLFTYLILLVVLRSLVLPLKAIFMNSLSLAASYGVLVYIFQEGHLCHWLHFEPQSMLDLSLVIIVFCAIFGFSMDYEVFLLTQIHEFYRLKQDNQRSIVSGIEQSARLITSAAMIVMCICASFMVADIIIIKEFGLGIAIAILVDAFIIRSILVPSTMTLLNRWNWYLPKWLDALLPYD